MDTARDWIRQYQIMLNNIKIGRIAAYVHIASNAANHLIPTTYELQYNSGKFDLEYVSNSISFKFQEVG